MHLWWWIQIYVTSPYKEFLPVCIQLNFQIKLDRVILGANKGRAYFVDRLAFWQNPDLLCSDEWLRTRRWCELISVCAFRLVLHGIKQFDSIFIKMFSPKDTFYYFTITLVGFKCSLHLTNPFALLTYLKAIEMTQH